jgi:hypothetical protein
VAIVVTVRAAEHRHADLVFADRFLGLAAFGELAQQVFETGGGFEDAARQDAVDQRPPFIITFD